MRRVLAVAFATVFVTPGVALADDDSENTAEDKPKGNTDEGTASGGAGQAVAVGKVSGRMTMPRGKILINAITEANLGKSAVGKPFSFAPDLWFGASDRLTLGLLHSGRGTTGFLTGAGRGLCFGDKNGVCAAGLGKIYTSVGAEARIGLTEGGFPIALAIGAVAEELKPDLVASGKTGFIARLQSNRVALELAPTVFSGITRRNVAVEPNKDVFSFPVTLFLKLSPAFAIAVQSGITLTIQQAADSYVVPAAAGLAWWISPKFSIDLAFGLTAVVDKDPMTKAFDGRSLSLGVGYGM